MKVGCELYAVEARVESRENDPGIQADLMTIAEQERLAEELNLTALAQKLRQETVALQEKRRPQTVISTPPLSDAELAIWKAWLPTSYRGTGLARYEFDLIPVSVMEQWLARKKEGLFDEYEIRTPEKISDPALFGIKADKYYLLARWSESDERLISFAEIKERMKKEIRAAGKANLLWLGSFVGGTALLALAIYLEALLELNNGWWLFLYIPTWVLTVTGIILSCAVTGFTKSDYKRTENIRLALRG